MFKQLRKWRGSLFPQTKVAAPSCAFERLEDRQLLSAAISSISADNRGMVMLGVTQDLNPSTVNSKTVQILVGGLDGQLGTKDDLRKRASVKYSQDTDTITISAKVPVNTRYRVLLMERYVESYLAEMSEFVRAVREGGPSPVSGTEARIPVVMAHAARRSAVENRPVRLSEIG